MVWEFMLSFMSPTDFEILQPSYYSFIESLSLWSIRKRRPTKLFCRSVLLRLTSKNIGSALPASQKSGQRSNNEAMPVIREGVCVWSGIPRSFSQNWTEGSFLKISLEKKPPNPTTWVRPPPTKGFLRTLSTEEAWKCWYPLDHVDDR